MQKITKVSAPEIKMNSREHFQLNSIKRQFDLSILFPLYEFVKNNIGKFHINQKYEFTTGRSTVIYSIDSNNTIQLITGWVGER